MSKPQITIKDIARELGVSPSTVSRALKDNPDISQETRNAVHTYAREHNYKPNALALNLRTSRSNTIGVIIPQLVHHFFSCVLSGIEETASQAGYNILVAQSNEKYEQEVKPGFVVLLRHSPKILLNMIIIRNYSTIIFQSSFMTVSVRVLIPKGW